MKQRQDLTLAILDASTFGDIDLSPISAGFGTCRFYPHTPAELCPARLGGVDVVVSNKVVLDQSLLEQFHPQLVCVAATGTNNVDLRAAAALGIPVTNVPGYSTASVVSHTMAMYFHLAHHNAYYDAYTRSGGWCRSEIFTHLDRPYPELDGKIWGIIGMGAIGRAVARAVEAFGCKVVYFSPGGGNLAQPWPHLPLAQLLGQVDVVSIHSPLTEKTRDLLGMPQFQQMNRNAILINTSRGGIVNESELATALDLELIGGAALDVLRREPPEADNPLWRVKNRERLLVTPHIAGLSIEARNRLVAEVGRNIDAFLAGTPRNLVT